MITIFDDGLDAYLNTTVCQRHRFQRWATSLLTHSLLIPATAVRNERRSPYHSFAGKNPIPCSGRRRYMCRLRRHALPFPGERACSTKRAKRILNIVLVILLAIEVQETDSLQRNLSYYPGKCRKHANIPHNVTRLYGGLCTLWIRSQVFVKYLWILPASSSSSGRTQPSKFLIWVVENNSEEI